MRSPVELRFELREALDVALAGGLVKRCHTVPMLQENTVAAHSYHVAWLSALLAREYDGLNLAGLLLHALAHDAPEARTGDVPGHVKAELGEAALRRFDAIERAALLPLRLPELSRLETQLLHFADTLDGLLMCAHERRLGNRYVCLMYDRYSRSAQRQLERAQSGELLPFPRTASMLLDIARERWHLAFADK